MKDGDIFRWKWKDPDKDADCGPYRSYHCKSRIALAHGGLLIDTFWHGTNSDYAVNPDLIVTTFLGNRDEMTRIPSGTKGYYKPSDIVDMRHSNHTTAPVYLKKGASKDPEIVLALVMEKIDDRESDVRFANGAISRLKELIPLIKEGRLDEVSI